MDRIVENIATTDDITEEELGEFEAFIEKAFAYPKKGAIALMGPQTKQYFMDKHGVPESAFQLIHDEDGNAMWEINTRENVSNSE